MKLQLGKKNDRCLLLVLALFIFFIVGMVLI